MTIGEFLVTHPQAAPALESIGIDFCCGGGRDLDHVLREHGLDPDTFLKVIRAVRTTELGGGAKQHLATAPQLDTPGLIDHIVGVHHEYLRKVLPRVSEASSKVARVHGPKSPSLGDLELAVHQLAAELSSHLHSEEEELFPSLRDGQPVTPELYQSLRDEHDGAGELLRTIRAASQDFAIPEWACLTYRALMTDLKELEDDLHVHIHLENNVLFERASSR